MPKVLWKKDAYFTIHETKHIMIVYAEMQLKPIVLRGAIIVIITVVFKWGFSMISLVHFTVKDWMYGI